MSEIEVTIKAIDLLEAIKNNDLEKTINLVNWLNLNFQPVEGLLTLNELISFHEILESLKKTNESFEYALYNLNGIENKDEMLWHVTIMKLVQNSNEDEIKAFILSILKNEEVLKYQRGALVRLSVVIDDYDLLRKVRAKIAESE
jgi:hypothetical protein